MPKSNQLLAAGPHGGWWARRKRSYHGEAIEAVGRYIEMGYKAIRVQSARARVSIKAHGVGEGDLYLRTGRQGPFRLTKRCGHALYLRHTPELFRSCDAYGYDHHLAARRPPPHDTDRGCSAGRDLEPRLFWLEDASAG